MSFKFQALGLALTSGCLLTAATTITTREPLAPASKSPAIAVQAVKPELEVAKGVVNSPAPQLSSRVATPSSASTPSSSASSGPTSAPVSSTSTTSSVSEVTKGEEETTPSTAVSKASAVSQPSGSSSTEVSVTSAATSSTPVVGTSSATESSAISSGAASGSSKAGHPVNTSTVDQMLANILGKKAASSSSAPADERSGDHQALKRGDASSTNNPQLQLPQTGNQGTGLTIAGLGLFAMVGSALKRSWVSQKI